MDGVLLLQGHNLLKGEVELCLQNLKYNVKRCVFHLILVCIPSSLILFLKNSKGGGVFT